MQITQFVIDLGVVYFGSVYSHVNKKRSLLMTSFLLLAYSHFVASYYSDTLPVIANCAGTEDAAVFGCVLLSSYLGLFINFYFQTYKKPVKGKKPIANGIAHGNGNANGQL
jgi:fatty acid elongase 3